MKDSLARRSFLKVGAAAFFASPLAKAAGLCAATPPQTEGPFYPVSDQNDKDWDLVRVRGQAREATGKIIFIRGRVLDQNCQPVPGSLVEIWQACSTGKYHHPNDPNPAPLDPNFQYWGRAITDAQGRYMFRTVLPGAYQADKTWWRPPHIHYKVHQRGFMELTTQLYFAGHPLNAKDKILQQLSPAQQAQVVRPIVPERTPAFQGEVVEFDLSVVRL